MLQGVYLATKKDGSKYYRASCHYRGRHISLGSFAVEQTAHLAYQEAVALLADNTCSLNQEISLEALPFEKAVSLINYRDNKLYIKTPIYLMNGYFRYYLSPDHFLIFDNDDLFYYSSHKIICRQGHMFVNDYGMQYNILARYGIKNYGVSGRDYIFANGNDADYRYSNVIIINKYHGILSSAKDGMPCYEARIHLNGDYLIGRYNTQAQAALAYNKAVDLARAYRWDKNFIENYITEYTASEYADIYHKTRISKKYIQYLKEQSSTSD